MKIESCCHARRTHILTQNLDKPKEVQVLGNTYYTGSVGNTEVVLVQRGLEKSCWL